MEVLQEHVGDLGGDLGAAEELHHLVEHLA
jgi:hypothetical protein